MIVVKSTPPDKKEKRALLKDARPGQHIVRFPGTTFEEAIAKKDEATFFQVIASPTGTQKAGRVTLVSIDGMLPIERDETHEVILHNATLHIDPAELE